VRALESNRKMGGGEGRERRRRGRREGGQIVERGERKLRQSMRDIWPNWTPINEAPRAILLQTGMKGELINGGTGFLGGKSLLLVSISLGELMPRKDLTSLIISRVSYFSTLWTSQPLDPATIELSRWYLNILCPYTFCLSATWERQVGAACL